jgi:signal peptidase I
VVGPLASVICNARLIDDEYVQGGDSVRITTYYKNGDVSKTLVAVPYGHVWLEGDNPRNSKDSRNFGAVPTALIVGRVVGKVSTLVSPLYKTAI